jgi:hypothetical protein
MPLNYATPGLYLAQNETAMLLLSGPGKMSESFAWSSSDVLRFDIVQVERGAATPLGWVEVQRGRADVPQLKVLVTWSRGQIEVRLRNLDGGSEAFMMTSSLS